MINYKQFKIEVIFAVNIRRSLVYVVKKVICAPAEIKSHVL